MTAPRLHALSLLKDNNKNSYKKKQWRSPSKKKKRRKKPKPEHVGIAMFAKLNVQCTTEFAISHQIIND
jgi:hypothetical protein